MLNTFENAFTHAPIGMALVDMTGRTLRVNDALCRITGYSAQEACERSFEQLSDPEDLDLDASNAAELLGGQVPSYQIEKRFRHASGEFVWVLLSVSLPILDLATNAISQYELLVRLRTDDGELLPPSAFLYVAERFGSILSIDSWVARQAIALIGMHTRGGAHLTLNMNLSAKSIGNPELITVVDDALADAGIDPACLVFEVTETDAIGNIDRANTFITEMRGRGCRFALDDFGSGFGSFYYLKHLPFDYLKIDGDFIRGVDANPTDHLVVEAVVGIARGMGKQTVAEFVTSQRMMDRLRRGGVDYAQGFHIGAPRPIADVLGQPGRRPSPVALPVH